MPKYTVAAAMVLLLTACNTVTAQKLKTTQDSESKIEMIEGPVVEQPKLDLNKPFPEGNSVMTAKPVLCSNVTELLGGISSTHGENLLGQGMVETQGNEQIMVFLLWNRDTKSYTLIEAFKNGMACLTSTGHMEIKALGEKTAIKGYEIHNSKRPMVLRISSSAN